MFEMHLRDIYWGGNFSYRGVRFGALARDIAGGIGIAEKYLRFGRQKRAIGAMIDTFLEEVEIIEHTVIDEECLLTALGDHDGELWITGPCLVAAYQPEYDLATMIA